MTNDTEQKNTTIQNVLEKIQNNELTSHSKAYFRWKIVAIIAISVLIFVISVFLFSFIFFVLRTSGQSDLLGFGPRGLTVFLLLFPWKLLTLDLVLMLILGWLLRSFRFGYKSPVLYLALVILIVMALCGYAVDCTTPLHDRLLHQADHHHLPPPFGFFYEEIRRPPPPPFGFGVFRGIIASSSGNVLEVNIENPDGTSTKLYIVNVFGNDQTGYQVGDRIFIEGDILNGEIEAHHVREAPSPDSDDNTQ